MEELCAQRRAEGAPVTVVRPFTVAGERQRPDMANARWNEDVHLGRPAQILGSPDRKRDITDVRDVVIGLLRVLEVGYVGTVNLGTGRARCLIDVLGAVTEAVGMPTRVVVEAAGHDEVVATLADTERCEKVFGFVPTSDLEAPVRRQVAASLASLPFGVAR